MSGKSGNTYVKAAQKGGCRVREGSDHVVIYPPDGMTAPNDRPFMTFPRHATLSKGVENKIEKWLKALGILLTLALTIAGIAGIF